MQLKTVSLGIFCDFFVKNLINYFPGVFVKNGCNLGLNTHNLTMRIFFVSNSGV